MFQSNRSCFITLFKKRGYSSASSLNRLKSILKIKKAGFCGTLDPIAEGVIVVAVNKATRLIRLVTDLDKVYSGKMKLGYVSPSYDTETTVESTGVDVDSSSIDILSLKNEFTGTIDQKPPSFSALKVDGKRAYQLAREGKMADLKSRKVVIHSLELSSFSPDELEFKVVCSKGTYIRSLVNDIGVKAGCGAVMTELAREQVGDFKAGNSVLVDDLKKDVSILESRGVTTVDDFLSRFKTIDINRKEYDHFRNGKDITDSGLEFSDGLSYLRYENSPAFLIEKNNGVCSYSAFLRDEND